MLASTPETCKIMIIIITMLLLSSILTMDFLTLKAIASLPNVNPFLCGHTEGNCGYVGTDSGIQLKWEAQPLHIKTSSNLSLLHNKDNNIK
jgi:hypothetical protein